jgi:hypothetical protein
MSRTRIAQPREVVASRQDAVDRFMEAGRKNLGDIRTEAEILEWAERTTDEYLRRGIIAIGAQA